MALLTEILMFYVLILIPKAHSLSIKMIRKDTIPSFFPTNLNLHQKHQKYADLARARVLHHRSQAAASFNSSSENTTDIDPNVIRPRMLTTSGSIHAVSVAIGSIPYYTLWELDSGSHFSWVQSALCHNCFLILGGAFNHLTSTTFHLMSWDDPRCEPRYQVYSSCAYALNYIGCASEGLVGTDTLGFQSSTGEHASIPGIVFGIALYTPGVAFDNKGSPNNMISGLFGIGTGINSFLTQTRDITHMCFSYCLPQWNAAPATEKFLTFGDDIPPPTAEQQHLVQTTPMRTDRYHLNLLDISVNGKALGLDPALFAQRPDGTGGFVIDTGGAQTSLVPNAYGPVKAALVLYFLSKGVRPLEPPPGFVYDLCYLWPMHVELLTLTFHFTNDANLSVAYGSLFQGFNNLVCLALLTIDEQGPNLLGAMQQANYRFVHDLNTEQLSFYPEQCSQR